MSENNRNERRDKKRERKRKGQRGPTGKFMFLLSEQFRKRAEKVKNERSQKTSRDPE